MNKICAIILAAGRGKRMGAAVNKQFLCIKDKPILYYSLKAFEACPSVDDIVLVAAEAEIEYCKKEIIEKYSIKKIRDVVPGGSERQDSVYKGLLAAKDCDIVLIHDGVRPFVNRSIIENGIDYALKFGACACGVVPKDTIKQKNSEGFSASTLDRNSLFIVQTPQCFKFNLIFRCHEKILGSGMLFTDDTSIAEYFGHQVYLYDGSYNNIKITTPEDLDIGEKILGNIPDI